MGSSNSKTQDYRQKAGSPGIRGPVDLDQGTAQSPLAPKHFLFPPIPNSVFLSLLRTRDNGFLAIPSTSLSLSFDTANTPPTPLTWMSCLYCSPLFPGNPVKQEKLERLPLYLQSVLQTSTQLCTTQPCSTQGSTQPSHPCSSQGSLASGVLSLKQ